MKKQLTIDRMKPLTNLKAIGLLALLALLTAGCYPATLAPPQENVRSKQVEPPPGKALVYFYLDYATHDLVDVAVSLNGYGGRISKYTYMLWEVFPGEYLLAFDSSKDQELEIKCEANQIYYYHNVYKSVFSQKLTQASDATGRAKINELSLVKWFKDIPAPGQSTVAKAQNVSTDAVEAAEPKKAQAPAQVPSDEAIALLELKIDKVSDEVQTIYNPRERRTTKTPILLFSPDEHIRSSLIQAKFRIASEDTKETPVATLAIRYHEKNKEPVLGSPKTYFFSYELTHRTRGKLLEAGVGPKGCDTQQQLENHPQFRDIGLLVRDAFIRSQVKAAAAEVAGDKTAKADEAVGMALQASDPAAGGKQQSDDRNVEPSAAEHIQMAKPQPSAETIGTIRLIMQKDSDMVISTFKDGILTGSRKRFEYEPDVDIKASLEQTGFEVITEDSNRPEDATLTACYEEKKRGTRVDSPTAYYFSFTLSHKTEGTLLEGSTKATGCDSAEELRNDPQFRDIGLLVRKTFVQEVAGDKESQEGGVPTQRQSAETAKSGDSVAGKHQTRIPLSKNDVVKIESISAIVGEGEASFSNSEKPGMLSAGVDGTIPVVDGVSCLFCVNRITIGPDTKVPLSPFFMPDSKLGSHGGKVAKSVTLKNIRMTGPGANEDTTEYILSGENGATLKKVGNGFILVEGQAYYVRNIDSEDSAAVDKTDNTTHKEPVSAETLLPPYTSPLQGRNVVRVRNPNDFKVTVGLRCGPQGKNFPVAAHGYSSVRVPNGEYDIYFVYSNEPDALFKGDDFSLNDNGVEIQIVKVVGGNYGIRRVK